MGTFRKIQAEYSKGTAYTSYDTDCTAAKYKFGFVAISNEMGMVCHIAFNSAKEYAEMLGDYEENYTALETLQVGQSITAIEPAGTCLYIRIF